jgi:DNA uptake protein ComE-like DNA-binding protein
LLAVWFALAENEPVRKTVGIAAVRFAVVALVLSVSCTTGAAQYSDRDSRSVPATRANAPRSEDRVDINHAALNELLKIPGMRPSWAGRIVRFRPYRSKVDLLERGIVTGAVYDRIKDYVIAHRDNK